jgi:hypothetical protein
LAVTLVSLLAASGLGSAWTTRWPDARLGRSLIAACGATLLLIVASVSIWPHFLSWTLGMPLAARIALAVVLLVPIGVCMGMPYPLGLRAVSGKNPAGLPWVWAVNAAASVLGSILAFALAMALGFQIVLLIGGACYVAALVSSWALIPAQPELTAALDHLPPHSSVRSSGSCGHSDYLAQASSGNPGVYQEDAQAPQAATASLPRRAQEGSRADAT